MTLSNNDSYTYDQLLTDCTQISNIRYPTDGDISTLINQTNSFSIFDPIHITVLKKINNALL